MGGRGEVSDFGAPYLLHICSALLLAQDEGCQPPKHWTLPAFLTSTPSGDQGELCSLAHCEGPWETMLEAESSPIFLPNFKYHSTLEPT